MNINRKRRIVLPIIGISLIAIFIIVMVWITSTNPGETKNGFARKISPLSAKKISETHCDVRLRSISGIDGDTLYCQGQQPTEIFVAPIVQDEAIFTKMTLSAEDFGTHFYSYVDAGKLYLYSSFPSVIFLYDLKNHTIKKSDTAISFMRVIPLSDHSYITRSVLDSTNTPVFIKMSNNIPVASLTLPNEKGDGGFATDGVLAYDRPSGNLFYMCYYNNRFYCLDTNLVVKYTSSTVDTFASMKTIGKEISKKGRKAFTLAAPPKFVNWHIAVSDNRLYINSLVQADNESPEDFHRNSVIDVYDINDGAYLHSFYIPAFKGEKLREFSVIQNRLYGLYGKKQSSVISYSLPSL